MTEPILPLSMARRKMTTINHQARVRALRFAIVAWYPALPGRRASTQPMRLARIRTAMTPPTSRPVS
jgi:hypothetical protein